MIASIDDIERRGRAHALAHILEKLERTEGIARSLHEEDRDLKLEQNLIAKLRPVAGAAKRIAEANHGLDRIDERDVAADAPAHAFPGEHDRPVMSGAKRGQRLPMRFDEPLQRVRALAAFQGIRIVERRNRADRFQKPGECPHSRMRRGSAGAGREQKSGSGIGHERQSIR